MKTITNATFTVKMRREPFEIHFGYFIKVFLRQLKHFKKKHNLFLDSSDRVPLLSFGAKSSFSFGPILAREGFIDRHVRHERCVCQHARPSFTRVLARETLFTKMSRLESTEMFTALEAKKFAWLKKRH